LLHLIFDGILESLWPIFSMADSDPLLLVRSLSPGCFALITGFANVAVAGRLLLLGLVKTFT